MASARARFEAARENIRVAGAATGLGADATASYERLRLSDNGLLPAELIGFNWYAQSDLGVRFRYSFDWWGKQRALIESADPAGPRRRRRAAGGETRAGVGRRHGVVRLAGRFGAPCDRRDANSRVPTGRCA